MVREFWRKVGDGGGAEVTLAVIQPVVVNVVDCGMVGGVGDMVVHFDGGLFFDFG